MNNKPAIIFVIALKQEIPDALKFIPTTTTKALLANDTRNISKGPYLCIISGVGKHNALKTIQWIHKHMCPDIIINIGSCGSTKENYLHTLICPQTIYHNQEHYHTIGTFPFLINKTLSITVVPSLESTETENKQPKHHFVDMESFWLAKACHENNIPFCCLKFVTDDNKENKDIAVTQQLPSLRKTFNVVFETLFTTEPITVSVIIPTFNRVATLVRAIQSVLNQSIQTELIVVDDGSTDQTKQQLTPYLTQLKIITLPKNKGVSYARNIGIATATGSWVMFLDSDDEWVSTKVESQLNYIKHNPHLSICQSQEKWIRNGLPFNKKKHHTKQQGFIWNYCLDRCMIAPSSVMIKKAVFNKFGLFDTTLPVCEDYDLWLRLSRHLLIGLEPSESLIKYGGHNDQLSTQYEIMDQFRITALRKQLKSETHPYLKKRLNATITKKQSIITNGKIKRQRIKND